MDKLLGMKVIRRPEMPATGLTFAIASSDESFAIVVKRGYVWQLQKVASGMMLRDELLFKPVWRVSYQGRVDADL